MNPGAPEDLIAQILRFSRRMRLDSGRGPSAAELAGYLHLPLAEVRAALARAKDRAAEGGAGGMEVPGGLAEALTADEEGVLRRRFGMDREFGQPAPPLDTAIRADLRALTDEVLAGLTPREREVLRKRFGLGMNTDRSLEEVGRQFSVTRERIRQIEARARARLSRKDPDDS